ncbi:MAG: type II toxin-antitoxin system VapC family toxin [Egibacteraceae bacterium]
MSLLLDTHTLLWWLAGERMTDAAIQAIQHTDALVCVSAASIWEAEIKATVGKLRLDADLVEEVETEGFEPLGITLMHARRAGRLPAVHRDPFDRMLVAQAQAEGLTVVTRDPVFDAYEVAVLGC